MEMLAVEGTEDEGLQIGCKDVLVVGNVYGGVRGEI